jgi:tRNA pseudouridine38-40 synthase
LRYFLTLSYLGTHYFGWQRQPTDASVQATLETALATILRQSVEVTGCGRTDAGVHARYFVAHFEAENAVPPTLLRSLNGLLPPDIAIFSIKKTHDDAHARFDAHRRAYEYHITARKDPMQNLTAWHLHQAEALDLDLLNQAAALLLDFQAFAPFCKTHSGVDSYACRLDEARWERSADGHSLVFHIAANRFLRGMVRLIVGACIGVAKGQLSLAQVRHALDTQTPLPKNLSVPAHGLFLTQVAYPFSVGEGEATQI